MSSLQEGSTSVASGSAAEAIQDEKSAQELPKAPERVYNLYSWKTDSPDTRLVYIRDAEVAGFELPKLIPGPLGFDLEWKPNYSKNTVQNPVALVQLANEDMIVLVQITAMRSTGFPQALRDVLENPKFIKAGVSILNDCKKLWEDYGVNVRNCVDLGLLARTVDNARWKGKYTNPIGLARLCETYHELTLHKGRVTRSNWEALLSPIQQTYAANDCHSGLTLLNKLYPLLDTIQPKPLPGFYSFDVFEGYPYQPSNLARPVMLWQAHNPFYDPGPPPPPRPPKPPKEKKKDQKEGNGTAGTTIQSGSTSTSRASLPPRPPPVTPAEFRGLRTGVMLVDPFPMRHHHRPPYSTSDEQAQGQTYHQNPYGGPRHLDERGRGNRRGWRGGRGGNRGGEGRGRGRGRGAGGSAGPVS